MTVQTTIVTTADVTARLSTAAYSRLFAKNGGSTVDTTFRDLCIAEANSVIRVLTGAAWPEGLYQTGDTLDPAVVGAAVDIVCKIAASRHPASAELGNFRLNGERAEAFLRLMNRDEDPRPAGSTTARPKPRATVTNTTTSAGEYTNPFTRVADQKDGSDF